MARLTVGTLRLGILPLLLGGLLSCSPSEPSGISLTNIRELKQSQMAGETVYLKGQVRSIAPFVDSGAYLLEDTTDNIWVMTSESLPKRGDEVLIRGQVDYESISIGGQEMGEVYVQELEQLERHSNGSPKLQNSSFVPENSDE
ncbi:MAG: hypothetical protein ACOC0N_09345 [Chroococcales cyanobacterium]